MSKFFENKPRAWFMIGAIAVAILAVASIGTTYLNKEAISTDLLATVNGEEITNDDLNEFVYGIAMGGTIDNPDLSDFDGVDRNQFLSMLIESKILEKESIQLNVSVTEEEVDKYITKIMPEMTKENILYPYVREYQSYQVLKEKVMSKVLGDKEGYWVIARSDIYLPGAGKEMTESHKTKTEENKAYSEKFINSIYDDLTANTITIEEAVKKENDDSFIGLDAPSENASLHSSAFDSITFKHREGPLGSAEILDATLTLKDGEFTKPIHLVTPEGVDVGWYIIYVTNSNSDVISSSYEEWFEGEYTQHQVEIYQENVK